MKKCVVVLGMYHSEISVMAGLLNILGVDFGKGLVYNTEVKENSSNYATLRPEFSNGQFEKTGNTTNQTVHNKKEYFEHIELVKINNAILDYLGTSQEDIAELSSGWEKEEKIRKFKEWIKDILQKEFKKVKLFGIKEQHIYLLLALYKEIFKELKIWPIFIILRKSIEAAKSLKIRDNFPLRKSILLYEKYIDSIERHTKGENRVFVEVEEIVNNTEEVIMNISREFKLGFRNYRDVRKEISRFIDKISKHHNIDYSDFLKEIEMQLEVKNSEINTLSLELKKRENRISELQKEMQQVEQLKIKLNDIEKSLTWKFSRGIDKFISSIFQEESILKDVYKSFIKKLRELVSGNVNRNVGKIDNVNVLKNENLSNNSNKRKLYSSICLFHKDENEYLNEWLEYHLNVLYFEKVVIYDNNSKIHPKHTINQKFLDRVIFEDWPYFNLGKQLNAYNHFIDKYREQFEWAAFIDADEFIVIRDSGYRNKENSGNYATFRPGFSNGQFGKTDNTIAQIVHINEFLKLYEHYCGLCVNWLIFGSSKHVKRPEGGVLRNYLYRTDDKLRDNFHVKTIAKISEVVEALSPHHFLFKKDFPINENFENVKNYMSEKCSANLITINHYFCRSEEEFNEKQKRGRGDAYGVAERKLFKEYDKNSVNYDDYAFRVFESHLKKKRETKVSIILPSYNYRWCISEAIESVIAQDYSQWELIVVDDGSSDNSIEVVRNYVERYPDKIKLYFHSDNSHKGLVESYKLGLSKCGGNFVAFIEADDILEKDNLSSRLEIFNNHTEVIVVYNNVEIFGDEKVVTERKNNVRLLTDDFPIKDIPFNAFEYLAEKNIVPTFSCFMVRRDFLDKVNFNTRLEPWLDWWLLAQLSLMGKFYFLSRNKTKWRLHDKSYNVVYQKSKIETFRRARHMKNEIMRYAERYLRSLKSDNNETIRDNYDYTKKINEKEVEISLLKRRIAEIQNNFLWRIFGRLRKII